jgi:hypothetical protein
MFIQIISNKQALKYTDDIWYSDIIGCVLKAEYVKGVVNNSYKIVGLPLMAKIPIKDSEYFGDYYIANEFYVFEEDARVIKDDMKIESVLLPMKGEK